MLRATLQLSQQKTFLFRHDKPLNRVEVNRPGFTGDRSFISRDHIEHIVLCIEVLFSLRWRDVSVGNKQTPVVEPIDPAKGGYFQILHVAPRTLTMNQLGFVETVNGFREGVVITVTDAAERRFGAILSQTLGVEN